MSRISQLVLTALLLFTFAVSILATIHSTVQAKEEYSCCVFWHPTCPQGSPYQSHGVWENGECTFYPTQNPNDCVLVLATCH